MVNTGKIVSTLFAFGLAGRCLADYNRTTQTVTYVPIVEEWAGESSNMTVTFDLVSADYLWLHNNTGILTKRTARETTVAAASVIALANSVLSIYGFITEVIKNKSNSDSCSMSYGTDSDGHS